MRSEQLSTAIVARMTEIRRHLHRHPELSNDEKETSAYVAQVLRQMNVDVKTGVGGHGVVADIQGASEDRCIALRADLDALPIHEETGLSFASSVDGVMHACGHDGHCAMLLGAAMAFAESAPRHSVRLIFQPAEELAQGAKRMIESGVLSGVDAIFGLHLDRHYPSGTIMISDDYVNAASDRFYIKVLGRGGHAARPHETQDAVLIASMIVSAIQTIVSREIDPSDPAVITVGKVIAGSAGNVIAGEATLEGSIRSLSPRVRTKLHESLHRIVASSADLHGASFDLRIEPGAPSLRNHESLLDTAKLAAAHAVGDANVLAPRSVNLGAEDFAYYLSHVPGAVARIGAAFDDRENHPAHSSHFDFDESALAVGAAYLANLALT